MDQAKLLALFQFLPFPAAFCDDAECKNIIVNKAMADVMATIYSGPLPEHASFISSPFYKIYRRGKELSIKELPLRQAVLLGQEVRDFEMDLMRPDGSVISLTAYATPFFARGRVTGGVAFYLDNTELRIARAELLSLRQERAMPGLVD